MQNKFKLQRLLVFLFILLIVLSACAEKKQSPAAENAGGKIIMRNESVRYALGAGTYYPGSARTLQRVIHDYIENAKNATGNGTIRMLLAPSAPLTYSGRVAADAYAQLVGDKKTGGYKRVVIVSLEKSERIGVTVPSQDAYETPLGKVLLDKPGVAFVRNMSLIHMGNDTSARVEIQLVFLQTILDDFTVLPMLAGRMSTQQLNQLSDLIQSLADEKTLVVISSVLSSGKSYLEAYRQDTKCLSAINRLQLTDAALNCEASARLGLLAALAAAKRMNLEPEVVTYVTSGDTVGSKDKVTGYAAVVFREAGKVVR